MTTWDLLDVVSTGGGGGGWSGAGADPGSPVSCLWVSDSLTSDMGQTTALNPCQRPLREEEKPHEGLSTVPEGAQRGSAAVAKTQAATTDS